MDLGCHNFLCYRLGPTINRITTFHHACFAVYLQPLIKSPIVVQYLNGASQGCLTREQLPV